MTLVKSARSVVRANRPAEVSLEKLEQRTLFAAVPAPFTPTSIGTTNVPGTSSYDGTAITITAANQDAFTADPSVDSIYYVYAKLIGNGSITTHVANTLPAPGGTFPLAGLNIRSSLDPTAQNVFLASRTDGDLVINDRPTDGGTGVNQSTPMGGNPIYIEIQRNGDTITELDSTDGTNFASIGTTTLTGLPNSVLIGFAQGSQNESVVSTATYDHFSTTGEVVSAVTGGAPPTATLMANNVPTGATGDYTFGVTYASSDFVSASSIGNGNIVVTGPNGYSQPATVVSSPSADGTSLTATYKLSPVPTVPGTYTIHLEPNQVSDASGNFTAGSVLGTFIVGQVPSVTGTVTNASTGAPIPNVRLFFDVNHDGIFQSTEPWAITDSSGDYTFGPAGNNTFAVTIQPPTDDTPGTPSTGVTSENTVLGMTQTGVNFTLNPAPVASITGAFTTLPTTITRGKSAKVTLTITNTTSAKVKGISVQLASNTTAVSSSSNIVIKTLPKFTLAAGASKTITTGITVSKKTTPAGNRFLLGLIKSPLSATVTTIASSTAIPFA